MINVRLLGGGEHAATDLDLVWVHVGADVIDGSDVLDGAAQIRGAAHIRLDDLVCPEVREPSDLGGAPDQGARRRANPCQSGNDGLARLTGSACHEDHAMVSRQSVEASAECLPPPRSSPRSLHDKPTNGLARSRPFSPSQAGLVGRRPPALSGCLAKRSGGRSIELSSRMQMALE